VCRGVHPINALVADSHDGFKSLFLPGWFMCIHAPGSLSFVCLLIRPRPGTYCRSSLPCRFGFVLLTRCSALGLPAGKRLVVWVGFGPSSPRSDRSDTHTPDPPSLTVRLVRAFLRFLHPLPRFGSRNLCACFLPRSPGFVPGPRFPLAPSGHARDPEFHASHSGLWAGFGVVCGGTVGLARSPVLRGAHAAIATVSSSCPIGFSFPGWVSYVVEGTRGGFWLR